MVRHFSTPLCGYFLMLYCIMALQSHRQNSRIYLQLGDFEVSCRAKSMDKGFLRLPAPGAHDLFDSLAARAGSLCGR